MTLFTSRIRVAIADTATKGLFSLANPGEANLCNLALEGWSDISKEATGQLKKAVTSPDCRQEALLAAFWDTYKAHIELAPSPCRLLINPPDFGLIGDAYNMTLNTQFYLRGSYGQVVPSMDLSPFLVSQIKGGSVGYFDDVAIFCGKGVDWDLILKYVAPESTITLILPAWEEHGFWMGWSGIDFSECLEKVNGKFTTQQIFRKDTGDVETVVYGLSSK